jgi:hypothetical protein
MDQEKIFNDLLEIVQSWEDDAKLPQYEYSKIGLLEAAKELKEYIGLCKTQIIINDTIKRLGL